jgi:hypothetical protein
MKYAVEIRSGAMIYIPNFIKIGSGIQKFMWGILTHTPAKNKINITLSHQSCRPVTGTAADLSPKGHYTSSDRLNEIPFFIWLPRTVIT